MKYQRPVAIQWLKSSEKLDRPFPHNSSLRPFYRLLLLSACALLAAIGSLLLHR